ncbi:DALR anticodon-binding domain-containing protein [Nocardia abscessus]
MRPAHTTSQHCLALCALTARTLTHGLNLLAIAAPERM